MSKRRQRVTVVSSTSERFKLRSAVGALSWAAMLGGAIWLLFSYVVTDAGLFLDYLRVLVWPIALAVAVYWLRHDVRDKVAQLLRLNAFGASAEFADVAAAADSDLESGLGGPLAQLGFSTPNEQTVLTMQRRWPALAWMALVETSPVAMAGLTTPQLAHALSPVVRGVSTKV